MRYSVQLKDQMFAKGYRFLSFGKSMDKIVDKNIGRNVSAKYSQNFHYRAKQSAKDKNYLKLNTTWKRVISKTAEVAVGDLNGNKIANTITKVSRISSQNNSEKNYK